MSDKESLSPKLSSYLTPVFSEDSLKDLVEKSPQAAADIIARQYDQVFELRRLEEKSRQRAAAGSEITKRIGIGLIFMTLVAVLVYAGATKDVVLPAKLIDVSVAAIAGLAAGSRIAAKG